jgi:hypothetical protein
MGFRWKRSACALAILGACVLARATRADEIRLKDGKKLYGVIVAYEDNMFKVKTDFGYVLIEKDKIASIIPSTPAKPKDGTVADAKPAKKEAPDATKPAAETVEAASKDEAPAKAELAVEPVKTAKAAEAKRGKSAGTSSKKAAEPAKTAATNPPASGQITTTAATPNPATPAPAAEAKPGDPPAAAAPKEPEAPAIREEVRGNTYINHTFGFQMYKAPSWNLLEDARRALPNAIVAMGTSNQATVMVVGQEKTKDPLETAAAAVEKRLHEAYENYRRLSEKKTTVSGLPAVMYRYRGKEGEHDWSGTLVVIARGKDIFTVLGVTYADDDLIQIQENVITHSIASLSFSAQLP